MEYLKLYQALSALNQCSVESVQSGNGFSEIDRYLHTERPVTEELIDKMIQIDMAGGGIILLVGSAGDGKSHLLSKVKDVEPERWPQESFYNDATASCSPNKTAIETLKEGLMDFCDANIDSTTKRKILAINLGKLNALIDDAEIGELYGAITKAVRPLFDGNENAPIESEKIKVVEFSNKQIFEFNPTREGYDALESAFMSQILDKVVAPKDNNPFFCAYKQDLAENGDNKKSPLILNYQLLMIPEVRRSVILYVIEAIIRYNLSITPREFLDFVYSIIVPINYSTYDERESFFESLLPSLLFSGGNNNILKALSKLDPLKRSSTTHDTTLSLLFTSSSIQGSILSIEHIPEYIITRTNQFYNNNGRDIERTAKFLFRLQHLLDYHSESIAYHKYIDSLRTVFSENVDKYDELYQLVSTAIPRHYGSYLAKQNNIPLNIQGGRYKMYADLSMIPSYPTYRFNRNKPYEFVPSYNLRWEIPMCGNVVLLVDYSLFEYLVDLSNGKLAITYENEKDMRFGNFVRHLASLSDQSKLITVANSDGNDVTIRKTFNRIHIQ